MYNIARLKMNMNMYAMYTYIAQYIHAMYNLHMYYALSIYTNHQLQIQWNLSYLDIKGFMTTYNS